MSFRVKPIVHGIALAFGGLVMAGFGSGPAHAQQAQQPQQLERIEVTGTNIRRTDTETVSPVIVIDRKDIQESGAITVADVLARLPIAGTAVDDRLSNGFTPGAGNVDLRGIGPQNTLLLLNGRRVGPYAFGNRAASTQIFQDLYALPLQDVERIEILKDGASAVYGADAVGGVINFITRRDYTGFSATARAGINQEGDGEVYGVDLVGGWGNLGKDKFNLYATFSYLHEGDVKVVDRDFAKTENLSPRGPDFRSSYAQPGTWIPFTGGSAARQPMGTCDFVGRFCREDRPQNPNNTLQPESDRMSGFARFTYDISPSLQFFAEALLMRNVAEFGGFGAAADRYRDPVTGEVLINNYILVPGSNPSNPYGVDVGARFRFDEVGGQGGKVTSDRWRGLLGLKGTIGSNWDWEVGGYYDKGEVEEKRFNQVTVDSYASVANVYNFTGSNPASVLNQIRYNGVRTGESDLTGFDAKIAGEIFKLPAGPLMGAFGYNYIKTEMRDTPDPASAASLVMGSSASAGFGEQTVNAFFAEFSIPVIKGVEAMAAVRYDDYSGNGSFSATSPKLGVKWQPTKELLLRTTWSQAFRAPSVYETSAASQTSFEFGLSDPLTCVNAGDPGCSLDVRVLETGNAKLQPEESDVWNVGLVFEPRVGLSFEVDYFNIKRKNEITSYDNQTLLELFGGNPNIVIRDPVTGLPVTLVNTYVNVNKSSVAGWDFGVKSRTPLGNNMGAVRANAFFTYYTRWEQETLVSDNGQPVIEAVNYLGTYGIPRARATGQLAWDYNAWSTALRVDYVKGQVYQYSDEKSASETVFGLNVAYNISKIWNVSLDIANLFDRDPAFFDDTRGSYAGFSPYFGDPYGRRFLLTTRYQFK